MFFPYINPWTVGLDHYGMVQRMRGSDCPILNQMSDPKKVSALLNVFPPSGDLIERLSKSEIHTLRLRRLAECLPLNWLVFHPAVPEPWAVSACHRLGWRYFADGSCVAPIRDRPVKGNVLDCL